MLLERLDLEHSKHDLAFFIVESTKLTTEESVSRFFGFGGNFYDDMWTTLDTLRHFSEVKLADIICRENRIIDDELTGRVSTIFAKLPKYSKW